MNRRLLDTVLQSIQCWTRLCACLPGCVQDGGEITNAFSKVWLSAADFRYSHRYSAGTGSGGWKSYRAKLTSSSSWVFLVIARKVVRYEKFWDIVRHACQSIVVKSGGWHGSPDIHSIWIYFSFTSTQRIAPISGWAPLWSMLFRTAYSTWPIVVWSRRWILHKIFGRDLPIFPFSSSLSIFFSETGCAKNLNFPRAPLGCILRLRVYLFQGMDLQFRRWILHKMSPFRQKMPIFRHSRACNS